MNILAVSHEYPPLGGGGANAAYNLIHGLIERGHNVTLVTVASKFDSDNSLQFGSSYDYTEISENENKTADIGERGNLHILWVNSRRSRRDSCSFFEMMDYMIKAYNSADEIVSKGSFDICFIFFGIPSGPIGYRLKRKYGIPYVIRFGGGDVPGFQKRFKYVYKILGPAIRAIWREASARVANSGGLRQMALDFCDRYPFDVITNGVDVNRFCPKSEIDPKDGVVNILFVSRLIERKGLQHIIPMLRDIETSSGKRITLTVVGEGPYRDILERITLECKVDDIVIFKGEKRGDDLVSEYRNGDIFILPSSNEGMPNVVLEAMACGLPVIMTPCQGSKELIQDNGFISDIDGFKQKLVYLISDDELRISMGRLGRKRAVDSFSWMGTVNKYEKLLVKHGREMRRGSL